MSQIQQKAKGINTSEGKPTDRCREHADELPDSMFKGKD